MTTEFVMNINLSAIVDAFAKGGILVFDLICGANVRPRRSLASRVGP